MFGMTDEDYSEGFLNGLLAMMSTSMAASVMSSVEVLVTSPEVPMSANRVPVPVVDVQVSAVGAVSAVERWLVSVTLHTASVVPCSTVVGRSDTSAKEKTAN